MQKFFYELLITEQNYQNVTLITIITHIKALYVYLINTFITKAFEKITKK